MRSRHRYLPYLLAALVVALGFLFRAWQTSPYASLLAIDRAIRSGDVRTFRRYVDVAELSTQLSLIVEQTSPRPAVRSRDAEAVDRRIGQSVRGGTFEQQGEGILGELLSKISGEGGRLRYIWPKWADGDEAGMAVAFSFPNYQQPLEAELQMRRDGAHWRVVRIANITDLQRQIAAAEKARIDALNQPILAEINRVLTVRGRRVQPEAGVHGGDLLEVTVANRGEKRIDRFHVVAILAGNGGEALAEGDFSVARKLLPGQEQTFLVGREAFPGLQREEAGWLARLAVDDIQFADGTELELYTPYNDVPVSSRTTRVVIQ